MTTGTCDDVDVRIGVLTQLCGVTVSLKRLPQLLLHRRRTAKTVETHNLENHTHTETEQVKLGGHFHSPIGRVLRLSRPGAVGNGIIMNDSLARTQESVVKCSSLKSNLDTICFL